ncbi:potassium-transporting ATPase B chain [Variibacter gotjawalensis]|uniref:Potassium-transporting ATPase ATP-binding subunit n=1 Tax=Variibacter gotjawalensis TaxID=1333996 RepID=A0A0S3PRG7_9BRAD|nr:potassium-transporting ATPase subunit KdpB [Variibacter gotjawalensis]NIK48766.1 K+-transporting ATPase ATPase B chain [Variibacter gotjawalensis]RZS50627.1 K+-transporting ATPase ATPase B chain [Variibacter gotjawalensis]BAT58460.1 potassium-transporting ATPase B chain [Variibacter gotjawalensis]
MSQSTTKTVTTSKSATSEIGLFDAAILRTAALQSFRKLDPRGLVRNPVIFVTALVAVLASILALRDLAHGAPNAFVGLQVAIWLWFTVLFANFAEAVAEGRGKARADAFRATKSNARAKVLIDPARRELFELKDLDEVEVGDMILVEVGDTVPTDGEIIEGVASVDESAITGESAPVIRESGGDRSSVTGGTRLVSDWLVVKVTAKQGETFLDRMIALVEGAKRHKTPNEIALDILLAGLTLVFLFVVVTLPIFASWTSTDIPVIYLAALFVTLIPTTIGGLLSAIGIAGMDRLVKANVIAKSGRAVEAAGDIDVLLLDKTGTITFGNRMADAFEALPGVGERELAEAAVLASLADDTPEGKSIVDLGQRNYSVAAQTRDGITFLPFTAQTRMSGADLPGGSEIRKGASDAILRYVGGKADAALDAIVRKIAMSGGTPLVVARDKRVLGVVHLKDIVKPGIRERFAELRRMGIRTVMITGDNPLTAAAIAAEAGVDDFLAEATPERKLELIRKEQAEGRLVAMCGDGSNDAPALAQADVGVAMNSGTPAAKEAGNLIDLDSDPTKLIEIVLVGKQLLISRGALTTFSIANDVAKYFAILPALFVTAYPGLAVLDIMRLGTPQSAILSAIIFNALVIVALIPIALKGVRYVPASAAALLSRNLAIYGIGGLIVPFVGIKLIDIVVDFLRLA